MSNCATGRPSLHPLLAVAAIVAIVVNLLLVARWLTDGSTWAKPLLELVTEIVRLLQLLARAVLGLGDFAPNVDGAAHIGYLDGYLQQSRL